jgi:hypothetical protein
MRNPRLRWPEPGNFTDICTVKCAKNTIIYGLPRQDVGGRALMDRSPKNRRRESFTRALPAGLRRAAPHIFLRRPTPCGGGLNDFARPKSGTVSFLVIAITPSAYRLNDFPRASSNNACVQIRVHRQETSHPAFFPGREFRFFPGVPFAGFVVTIDRIPDRIVDDKSGP